MSEQDDLDRFRYLQLKAKMVGPKQETQDQSSNYKQVIGNSIKDMFQKPAAFAKDLGTNPESMANAMPALGGAAGTMLAPWGGTTAGTAAGQGVRDIALTALKKPVPGLLQHGVELGSAALGDVIPVPMIKKSYYGGQIGNAEKAAGVVTRAPMKAVTPGSVGETLNNLEAQIDAGTINNPQTAKDAKAVISQIYKNPKIYEQTPEISVQAARVSKKTQALLNKMIPGRSEPAQAMGQAMTIPNAIKNVWTKTPWAVKRAAQGTAGVLGVEEIYKLLRGGR